MALASLRRSAPGLRYRLLAVLLSALALIALFEWQLQRSRAVLEREAAERLLAGAHTAAARLDAVFAQSRLWFDEMERLIDTQELQGDAAPDERRLAEIGQWIDDMRRRNPVIANIGYLDERGRSYRQRGRQGNGLDLSERPYWQELLRLGPRGSGRVVVAPPHRLHSNGQWAIVHARGLYGPDSRLAGAMAVGFQLARLEALLADVQPQGDGDALLLALDGSLLVRAPGPARPAGVQELTGPVPGTLLLQLQDGRRQLVAAQDLREAPYRVRLALGEQQVLSAWRQHASDMRLAMVAVAVAALAVLALLLREAQQQARLASAERVLALSLDLLPSAGVHAMGAALHIAHANAAARELLDLSGAEPRRLADLFVEPEAWAGLLAQALQRGQAGPQDVRLRRGSLVFRASVQLRSLDGADELLLTLLDVEADRQREDELRRQSGTDALTGLANRRAFGDEAARWVAHCRRQQQPLSLMMLDLDRFKAINDRYGHPGGDAVLREVARRLQAQLRSPDTVARVGGEEFALLLPTTAAAAAEGVARRLLQALRETAVDISPGVQQQVTASIGLADWLPDEDDIEWAWARADAALYAAKQAGRDRFQRG